MSEPTDQTDPTAFQRLISFGPGYRLTNNFRHLKDNLINYSQW